jgi:hypothetical protein
VEHAILPSECFGRMFVPNTKIPSTKALGPMKTLRRLSLILAAVVVACSSPSNGSNSPTALDAGASSEGASGGPSSDSSTGGTTDGGPVEDTSSVAPSIPCVGDASYLGRCLRDCGSYTSGYPTCDLCIQSTPEVCTQAVSCDTPDDGGVDDAGATRCEQLLACVQNCAVAGAEAGVSTGQCVTICKAGYNLTEYMNYDGLVSMIGLLCPNSCPVIAQ